MVNNVFENVDGNFWNENLKNIHSNPKVVQAILDFEKGEMCHEVSMCVTCLINVHPVFHRTKSSRTFVTGQPPPIVVETWKIYKDGRCKGCHEERLKNKRDNSGIVCLDVTK